MPRFGTTTGSAAGGVNSVSDRPDVPHLIDRFGRVARDLRISITEKCSLRCTYCMPEEGLPAIPAAALLTPAEIARVVSVSVRLLGIRDVRFTGGEPLMRRDLDDILRLCRDAAEGVPLSMTTNAVGLEHRARSLADAGLTRVNVSLDSVDREDFARLTRRDRLPSVLAGIRAAQRAGIGPVKVNAVLMRDTLSGAVDLLRWCLDEGVALRFIEQMPLDADHEWARANMIDAQTLLDELSTEFDLREVGRADPSAPAEEWSVDGTDATVGIIASVTRSFCGDCDRTRITAEGTIRSCLFSDDETDLRAALRGGATDEELAAVWRGAMWNKWAGHGIDADGFVPPTRSMGAIGG
ncbi:MULTISPECIES: GTP 3',8-cyclase MoaA [Rhodococcus]|uniref:GTP 3',8-cyclase n=2 Tax=Rhodococcus TaxID=1827 RepID=A0ABU4AS75_9NOCA|nr:MULTISPECIES: GTP 3',8-cyclase MoaA [Rhodococcus]KAA0928583.1 GTP 3',8-cyclase MoaA [Rhodococcus sp. ANT_H53B]MDV6229100.1 GTP 3',8-cyclase MoaA [Rhodococcus cercidiphylli]MDV6301431.1 GTP 3',8-cyclase MoaA [Rhodococcus cerastii]MDV8055152.1 GTP 3',8-cyclase MoaA [Rhodococcus sp. IEGM 1343]MDV8075780.1 GTP 3',8-cyclase MoaA [Rhodococcus sp. IEGM 1370]